MDNNIDCLFDCITCACVCVCVCMCVCVCVCMLMNCNYIIGLHVLLEFMASEASVSHALHYLSSMLCVVNGMSKLLLHSLLLLLLLLLFLCLLL